MSIAAEVRQSASRSGCTLRDMCEQECTSKVVNETNRTVQFRFVDGSNIDMLAIQDDME
jgi:hypothetical protein